MPDRDFLAEIENIDNQGKKLTYDALEQVITELKKDIDDSGILKIAASGYAEALTINMEKKMYKGLDNVVQKVMAGRLPPSGKINSGNWFRADEESYILDYSDKPGIYFNPQASGVHGQFLEALLFGQKPSNTEEADILLGNTGLIGSIKKEIRTELKSIGTDQGDLKVGTHVTRYINQGLIDEVRKTGYLIQQTAIKDKDGKEILSGSYIDEMVAAAIGLVKICMKIMSLLLVRTAKKEITEGIETIRINKSGKESSKKKVIWSKFKYVSAVVYAQLKVNEIMERFKERYKPEGKGAPFLSKGRDFGLFKMSTAKYKGTNSDNYYMGSATITVEINIKDMIEKTAREMSEKTIAEGGGLYSSRDDLWLNPRSRRAFFDTMLDSVKAFNEAGRQKIWMVYD